MICPHDTNQNQYCRDCGGSALCQKHKKQYCKMCDPIGYLFNNVRARINGALKKAQISKTNRTIGYLGCTIYFYKEYLEGKFKEEMTWENHGQGVGNRNIDHVIPLQFKRDGKNPTAEESENRLHYTNLCGGKRIYLKGTGI